MGCIARDHNGRVLYSSNKATGRSLSAKEVEAKACLGALKKIPKPDNWLVVLESDNAAVVDAIKNKNQKLSSLWHTYEEIETMDELALFLLLSTWRWMSGQRPRVEDLRVEAAASETMLGNCFMGWRSCWHGLGGNLVSLVRRGCRLGLRPSGEVV
jgi:ribonuclease HI